MESDAASAQLRARRAAPPDPLAHADPPSATAIRIHVMGEDSGGPLPARGCMAVELM
jgi:hypothetical protein